MSKRLTSTTHRLNRSSGANHSYCSICVVGPISRYQAEPPVDIQVWGAAGVSEPGPEGMRIMSDNRWGWRGRDDWRDNRDNDWRRHRHDDDHDHGHDDRHDRDR